MSNQLQRKLLEQAHDATLVKYSKIEWQSVTFTGHRHQLTFQFMDEPSRVSFAERVIDGKVDVNLIDGTMLCDVCLLEVDMELNTITVEALTLNE